jgi:NTP pyrophosphatase (non-canonical NTP hydrolase)
MILIIGTIKKEFTATFDSLIGVFGVVTHIHPQAWILETSHAVEPIIALCSNLMVEQPPGSKDAPGLLLNNVTSLQVISKRDLDTSTPDTFDRYQELAIRTLQKGLTRQDAIANMTLGVAGESGEVADMIKKHLYHGDKLDLDALIKEMGDVLWYLACLSHVLGVPLSKVATDNIDKLRDRWENGFVRSDVIKEAP